MHHRYFVSTITRIIVSFNKINKYKILIQSPFGKKTQESVFVPVLSFWILLRMEYLIDFVYILNEFFEVG